ncbi:MAG: SPOR domain-containing protein [Candidatus Saccharibacteria bacterium]|nr:SPOR domain-containing protein [Moraxellaceae bacterium]
MSANQQRWMGGIILLGGSALLASFLFQGNGQKDNPSPRGAPVEKTLNLEPTHRIGGQSQSTDSLAESDISNRSVGTEDGAEQSVQLTPLAVDVDTERKLLAAQHDMREKKVAEQEARTAEFLARQQQAEADSARKVAAEQVARLNARNAKNDALTSTDPAAPDTPVASMDDPVQEAAQKKAEQRRLAAQDQAEQARLRAQIAADKHDQTQQAVAQATEKTAKAKALRESAEKTQMAAEKERHLQELKARQDKLAKEKQAKLDALEAKKALEAKQLKEKLAEEKQAKLDALEAKKALEAKQLKEKLAKEKQDKLDAAEEKLETLKAAKLKIIQAEKAERAKLRGETPESDEKSASLTALQAQVEKNKREAALLQAKLDKLNAANGGKTPVLTDAQKIKDAARARALLEGTLAPTATTTTVAPKTLVMVQVAMAESQAKADSMVAQLRAKGYKVRTSTTNKGVRVLVGPEKDTAAASTTKSKIEQDSSLNIKGAWVSNWQPPTS